MGKSELPFKVIEPANHDFTPGGYFHIRGKEQLDILELASGVIPIG